MRDPEVGVIEAAVVERHGTERRLAEIHADTATVDESRAMEGRLREVATRKVTTHELDVDEPSPYERLTRVARADDSRADELTVVVEIESIGHGHRAILTPDVVTRHTRAFPSARLL